MPHRMRRIHILTSSPKSPGASHQQHQPTTPHPSSPQPSSNPHLTTWHAEQKYLTHLPTYLLRIHPKWITPT